MSISTELPERLRDEPDRLLREHRRSTELDLLEPATLIGGDLLIDFVGPSAETPQNLTLYFGLRARIRHDVANAAEQVDERRERKHDETECEQALWPPLADENDEEATAGVGDENVAVPEQIGVCQPDHEQPERPCEMKAASRLVAPFF